MNTKRISCSLVLALLVAGPLHGETLYEKDGITLEGSVRAVHRNAATCQIVEENEYPTYMSASKPTTASHCTCGGSTTAR